MIKDKQTAHDVIADAVYWLSGFAAAKNDNEPEGADASRMAENLRDVQRWLDAAGKQTSLNSESKSK